MRARSKPQHAMTSTSGSRRRGRRPRRPAAASSPATADADRRRRPARPARVPSARSRTAGRSTRAARSAAVAHGAARARTASTRASSCSMSAIGPSATPSAAATRRMSPKTSARVCGSRFTTCGGPGSVAAKAVTRPEADGADVAQPLGDDDVGREPPQQRLVHGVERAGAFELRLHPAVDLGARQRVAVDRAAGDARQLVHGRREVALVAHADEVVEHAERGDDLGRGRQQRDDAHARVVAVSRDSRRPGAPPGGLSVPRPARDNDGAMGRRGGRDADDALARDRRRGEPPGRGARMARGAAARRRGAGGRAGLGSLRRPRARRARRRPARGSAWCAPRSPGSPRGWRRRASRSARLASR